MQPFPSVTDQGALEGGEALVVVVLAVVVVMVVVVDVVVEVLVVVVLEEVDVLVFLRCYFCRAESPSFVLYRRI